MDPVRRVALVSPGWPPDAHPNGIVTYVQHIRAGLREHGVEGRVVAAASSPGGEEAEPLFGGLLRNNLAGRLASRATWRLSPGLAGHLIPAVETVHGLRRLERRWPFDVLEMEETFGTVRWAARAVAAPVVVRLHGPWIVNGPVHGGVADDAAFRARVAAEGRAIAAAAAVSSPSRDVLDRVRRHYGLSLPDAVVIPNPGPEPVAAHAWSADFAEPGHVAFVGRFDCHKGGDIAIDAFTLLAGRHPSLRLTVAGPDRGVVDGSGRRWSLAEYVAAKVPEPFRQRLCCVGQLTPDALAALRQRASVVVSAARYENFPMAALEAQSQGCPFVCPDVGGLPEIVEDGRTGLLFPAGDAAALAGRIASLLTAPARAAELGRQALLSYRDRFTPRQVAGRMLDFYREVCRYHRKRSQRGPDQP